MLECGIAGFNERMFYHTGHISDTTKDVGAVFLGDTKLTATVKKSIENKSNLSQLLGTNVPLPGGRQILA